MLTPPTLAAASGLIETVVDKHDDELLDLRRDLHAHPELSWREHRTTDGRRRRDRARPAGG